MGRVRLYTPTPEEVSLAKRRVIRVKRLKSVVLAALEAVNQKLRESLDEDAPLGIHLSGAGGLDLSDMMKEDGVRMRFALEKEAVWKDETSPNWDEVRNPLFTPQTKKK